MRRHGPPWAAVGRVAACASQADQPPASAAQVVRFDVPAGQELCIVGDLHGQFEVRISGLLLH